MLSKILLVTILILLSWNSIQTSNNNAYLGSKLIELKVNNESIKAQIENNQNLIKKQNKAFDKFAGLSESNISILKKVTGIELSIKTNATNDSKALLTTKGSIEKIKSTVDKHSLLLAENKKTGDLIKKSNSEIKGLLYKVSKNVSKYSNSLRASHSCNKSSDCSSTNHAYTKKKPTKPKVVNTKPLTDSTSLNKLFFLLYKTKEFQKKKQMKEALVQLSKLKSELWKSRDHKNISKELVMSTLSSIDIAKNKWNSKERNYPLDNVEEKLNRLICKPGVCK